MPSGSSGSSSGGVPLIVELSVLECCEYLGATPSERLCTGSAQSEDIIFVVATENTVRPFYDKYAR
jgi:hypothetical protein